MFTNFIAHAGLIKKMVLWSMGAEETELSVSDAEELGGRVESLKAIKVFVQIWETYIVADQ